MACPRISYRRRMHYATRGNLVKKIRTPGNRLIFQAVKKRSQGPHTPWVLGHKRLSGTKALRRFDATKQSNSHAKSVSRAYGGVLSAEQVRDRIIRAFLVEEQRIARRMDVDKKKYKKLKVRRLNKLKKKKSKAAAGKSAPAAGKKGATKPVAGAKAAAAAKKGGAAAAAGAKKGGAAAKTAAPTPAAAKPAPKTVAPAAAKVAPKAAAAKAAPKAAKK